VGNLHDVESDPLKLHKMQMHDDGVASDPLKGALPRERPPNPIINVSMA